MTARRVFIIAAFLLGACGKAMPPQQPETPPKAETPPTAVAPQRSQASPRAVPPPRAEAPPKAETPPPTASAPSPPAAAAPPPAASAPSPPTAAAPKKPAPPPKPPASTVAAKPVPPPPAPKPPAPEAARPTPPPLDLESLEARLKDTGAIGLLTKLSLKNQVDDLIERFLAFHEGKRPPTLSELRPAYELLLMKILSLLQDKDTALAHDINASREAIWSLLTDRGKLARYK